MKLSAFLVVLLVLVVGACDTGDPEPEIVEIPPPRVVADSSYTVTESGLKIFDFEKGDTTRAQANSSETVRILFAGWLENGVFFDGSVSSGPLQFVLGNGSVIEGIDEGLEGMYLGGDRQLVIPPDLAYGEDGNELVPGNATLIFEIVLIGAQ